MGGRVKRITDIMLSFGNLVAYIVFIVLGVIVVLFLADWIYTQWYVTTHCTMVLGTRVCK